MNRINPIGNLAAAHKEAVTAKLGDIETTVQGLKGPEQRHRRPRPDEVRTYLFPQTWGTTATGFDSVTALAGQSMTTTETVVVIGPAGDAAVYFGSQHAYTIKKPNPLFFADLSAHAMKPVSQAKQYEVA